MSNDRNALGRRGEALARDFLIARGMTVVATNWRCRAGELDLVCLDGPVLVGVEVKTRSGDRFGQPLEAVDDRKAWRLRRLTWLCARDRGMLDAVDAPPDDGGGIRRTRVDLLGILLEPDRVPQIAYVRGAA